VKGDPMSRSVPAIVVGVDGSTSALQATRWAAREAARRKLALRVVQACVPPRISHPTSRTVQEEYLDALHQQSRHWAREAVAVARREVPGLAVVDVFRVGHPAGVLIEESVGAPMVVLGSRGLGGFPDLRAGSVAVAVAEHARCPVVVVRGSTVDDPPPVGGPLVVGVDGSAASDAAVSFAFETAASRRAELIAVHAWNDVTFDGAWTRVPLAADRRVIAEQQLRLLDEWLAGWREKYPEVPVRGLVVRDQPVRALLKAAEDAGAWLVVVGARGVGGDLTGMGMGSTSRALLYHAACPVAVVESEQDSQEGMGR
jgi:nucleotide-binding universal stress UspA family protein